MKLCPQCGEVFPSGVASCPDHAAALIAWSDLDTHTDVDVVAAPAEAPFGLAQVAGEIALFDREPSSAGRTPRQFRAPREGVVLGQRYRLGKQIGVGGYGAVFAAIDELHGRRVAVKVLSPAAAENHELLTRFHREAIAASRIQHPHIVDVLDFDVDNGGTNYIVMEYLDGTDLSVLLDVRRVIDPIDALIIVAQCACGLAAAHQAGILHRDLKPANVFLVRRPSGELFVKIIDFGISKLTRVAGHYSDLTSASKVVGTPSYLSPEQARGQELDGRCDVYGLGVILFEMLTGQRPFRGESALEILTKHIEAPRVPPSRLRPSLAKVSGLDELVLDAIAASPGDRHLSMQELGQVIRECVELAHPAALARLPSSWPGDDDTTARVDSVAGRGSRRLRAVVVASLVVVAVSLAVWSTSRGWGSPPSPDQPKRVAMVGRHAQSPHPLERPQDADGVLSPAPVVAKTAVEPVAKTAVEPVAKTAIDAAARPASRSVRLTSAPSGALLYRGGRAVGKTPKTVVVSDGEPQRLVLRAPGRRARRVKLDGSRDHIHVRLPRRRREAVERKTLRVERKAPTLGIEEW